MRRSIPGEAAASDPEGAGKPRGVQGGRGRIGYARAEARWQRIEEWRRRALVRAVGAGELSQREICAEWHVSGEVVAWARRVAARP